MQIDIIIIIDANWHHHHCTLTSSSLHIDIIIDAHWHHWYTSTPSIIHRSLKPLCHCTLRIISKYLYFLHCMFKDNKDAIDKKNPKDLKFVRTNTTGSEFTYVFPKVICCFLLYGVFQQWIFCLVDIFTSFVNLKIIATQYCMSFYSLKLV